MKKNLSFPLFLFFSISILLSCNKDKLKADIPAYFEINQFAISDSCFSDEPNRPSITSQQVSDIWVYLNGNLQGTYELPVKFPIIASGKQEIEIRPGIKQNGISATRAIYPFYEFYTNSFTFKEGETISLSPCLAYKNRSEATGDIEIAWSEDFENVVDLNYNNFSDTVITKASSEGAKGRGLFVGEINLGPNDNFFEMIAPSLPNLPRNGTPIYLEIDYRSNHEFFVGLYTNNLLDQISLYGIRAKDTWNKVYVDLTETVRINGNSPNFNIYIGFIKNPGVSEVNIQLDNLKVIHF